MSVQRQPLPHKDCTGCMRLLPCTDCRGYRLFLQNTGYTDCRQLLLLHKDCMPKQFSGAAHNIRLLHRQRMPNMDCMGYKLLPCTGYKGCRPFWLSRGYMGCRLQVLLLNKDCTPPSLLLHRGCTGCRLLPLLLNKDCTPPSLPLHRGCTDCRLQASRPRMGCKPLTPRAHLRRFRLPWHQHSG